MALREQILPKQSWWKACLARSDKLATNRTAFVQVGVAIFNYKL